MIEGIQSISERLIRNLAASGQKIGQDAVGTFNEPSMIDGQDLEKFGSPAQSHYGWVQNYMADLIAAFTSLPAELVVFTSHESKGEDSITSQAVYGPGMAGKKGSVNLPWKLGDMFHLDVAVVPAGKPNLPPSIEHRLYFQKHADSENGSVFWPASPRVTPVQMKKLQEKWPNGYLNLTSGESVVDYLKFRESLAEDESLRLKALREKFLATVQPKP